MLQNTIFIERRIDQLVIQAAAIPLADTAAIKSAYARIGRLAILLGEQWLDDQLDQLVPHANAIGDDDSEPLGVVAVRVGALGMAALRLRGIEPSPSFKLAQRSARASHFD